MENILFFKGKISNNTKSFENTNLPVHKSHKNENI